MTDATTSVYYDEEEIVEDEIPRRPQRRLVTPATLVLGAILVGALGFFGGVKAQKSSGSGSSGAGANPAAAALATNGAPRGAGRFPGAGQGDGGGAAPTFGTVASKNGNTLYVKDANGNTVKVKATSNSKVTRNASSSVSGVHPGDTVVVQGAKSSSGTITATQITATASDATGGLGAIFGGRGGAFPGGAAGKGGGGSPSIQVTPGPG